ncbi:MULTISPECIES: hypothetical protein [unclassified Streptomyces]|uniref:hypothetical protein n=1 Tax=unclassified Streptomyces TaxID=2593676 RepID=UPI002E34FF33|nr:MULTISPECIES: hypothetical protein [unclassified Streptomyces]WUC69146.1 hypothetical protein OG861_33425 [Streptomyces sp. NBC_00539]
MKTHGINLVVLHDLDPVRAAIEQAASTADASEAPGLRRALSLLDEYRHSDTDIKVRWARQYLDEAGVPAGDTSARTIKKLRQAVPSLGLGEAVALVTLAAER